MYHLRMYGEDSALDLCMFAITSTILQGAITNPARIDAALPTINYALEHGVKVLLS